MRRALLAASLLAAAAALDGCGKTGDLDQPRPLIGEKAKADYDAEKARQAAERAAAAERRRTDMGGTVLDPTSQPLTEAPYAPSIPGRTDPLGPGPQAPGQGPVAAPDQ